jgi:adenylate kinase family enzyme
MKLYIVGPVSSGKSTLAKKISYKLNIPYHSLDEVVHIPDQTHPWGNRKRPPEERDILFYSIINQQQWIIEDVGRPIFEDGLGQADLIILLDTPARVRKYRIIKRWVRQRLGLEKCIYRPHFKMLRGMYQWSRNYDTGKDNLKERIIKYQEKIITLKRKKDIDLFLENIT